MTSSNSNKLDGLQLARSIAALSVVIFHAKLILLRFPDSEYLRLPYFWKHGDIGVSFFFVISGFIICYVIERPTHSALKFFVKRFFRLWPIYAFCTCLFMLVFILNRNMSPSDLDMNISRVFASLTFWPMGPRPILQTGWSLEHEVLFYLLAGSLSLAGGRAKFLVSTLAIISLIGAFTRVVVPTLGGNHIGWDYHIFAPANICFLFGGLLYLHWKRKPQVNSIPWITTGVFALLFAPYIVESIPQLLEHSRADRDLRKGYVRFTLESLASIALLRGLISINVKGIAGKIAVSIGDRSYSLYLVHFIIIQLFIAIHRELIDWPQWMAEPLCIIFVATSIIAAYVLHWCIEKPTAEYGFKVASRIEQKELQLQVRSQFSPGG